MKVRTSIFGAPQKALRFDPKATDGATVGTNLYWPDGTLVTPQQLGGAGAAAPSSGSAYSASTAGGSAAAGGGALASPTNWSSILGIPANIVQAAALAAAGLVTRLASGSWVARVLTGVAGRTVVANGDGSAGDPTVDLAAVSNSGTGSLQATNVDAYGRVTGTRAVTTDDLPATAVHAYDRNLVFVQGTPLASWSIAHNLGKYPSVTVVNSAGDEVVADVNFVDANNLVLTFATSFAGKAFIN